VLEILETNVTIPPVLNETAAVTSNKVFTLTLPVPESEPALVTIS